MSIPSTKERILDSTEKLLAEQGFVGLSIRKISHAATANVAAVNYHFGNKSELIKCVLERRLSHLFKVRQTMLNELKKNNPEYSLQAVLRAFIIPALQMANQPKQGGRTFMIVLARAYAEKGDELHQLMTDKYLKTIKNFADAIHHAVPHLTAGTVFWRFHFLIGSLTYAMSDFGASSISKQLSSDDYLHTLAAELVDFAVAALRA